MTKARQSDPLLAGVAELAREETQDIWSDPAWEAMARGELSESEMATLLARAEAAGHPEAAEVFRPLDQADEDRIMSAIDAARGDRVASSARDDDMPPPARAAGSTGTVDLAEARQKRALGRLLSMFGGMAAAAALVLFLVTRSGPGAELPIYELSVRGGARDMRGAGDADDVRIRPGDSFSVNLRPASRTDETLDMRAYLLTPDHATLLGGRMETSEGGFLRAKLVLPDDVGPSSQAELVVLVGRPAALGGTLSREDLVRMGEGDAGEVQVLRASVEISEAGPSPELDP